MNQALETQKQQENVFRLSARIFADKNYELSPVVLHRAIVEDALYQLNNNDGISLYYLIKYIEDEYLLSFSESEVKKVLHDPKNGKRFYAKPIQDGSFLYLLNVNRRIILDKRNTKTLGDFISQYIRENNVSETSSEKIYRYLYDVYTNNVDSFNRLLAAKNVKEIASFHAPNADDAKIINGFLDWDNPEKNEAIFNLASYALEYCMLTCKKGSSLKIENLQRKRFYLDTNILYRALGINGKERQERTLSFFKKLNETNSELLLSKVTVSEFENSLSSYIKKLKKTEMPAVHSKVYTEYVDYDDIWRYYHDWASKNPNPSIEVFEVLLDSQFKSIQEKYHIVEDQFSPFKEEEKEPLLKEMTSSIRRYSADKYYDTAYNDAHNILWVESARKKGEDSIFSTKTFLLSSDWNLHRWDSKEYSHENPIVIMPSQWLSILLRFGNRTPDDFKSFVCFLNIQTKDGVLSSEQISVILAGISAMTTNIEQQKYFLESIIEKEFKEGARGLTNDQLRKIAEKEAERMLQERLENAENRASYMEGNIAELKLKLNTKEQNERGIKEQKYKAEQQNQELLGEKKRLERVNSELQYTNSDLNARISESDSIIKGLWEKEYNDKMMKRDRYRKKEILKWRVWATVWCVLFILLLIACIVLGIISRNNTSPFFVFIKEITDVKLAVLTIPVILSIVNYFTGMHCYNCWFNPTFISAKIDAIEFPEDIREIDIDEFRKQNKAQNR